jgi:hypothetical protein
MNLSSLLLIIINFHKLNKRILQLLLIQQQCLLQLICTQKKEIVLAHKRLKKRVRNLSLTPISHKPHYFFKHPQIKRNSGNILGVDIHGITGIFEDDFEHLFQQIQWRLVQPRIVGHRITSCTLVPRVCLLLVLQWLREYPKYKLLARTYHISSSQVSREIHHILPILYSHLDEVKFPQQWSSNVWEGVSAIIDCTSHFRNRVHPRQGDYYRADKHRHFLTAENVVDLQGCIIFTVIGQGHNNDMGMFQLTSLGK